MLQICSGVQLPGCYLSASGDSSAPSETVKGNAAAILHFPAGPLGMDFSTRAAQLKAAACLEKGLGWSSSSGNSDMCLLVCTTQAMSQVSAMLCMACSFEILLQT